MRLGTDTGSLVNYILSHDRAHAIEIGMGATILGWTDRNPATVVEAWKKGKSCFVVVQEDNYTRTDKNGMSECQEYEYTRNPDGRKLTFRSTSNGAYQQVYKNENGRYVKSGSDLGITLGKRERYYDFSF